MKFVYSFFYYIKTQTSALTTICCPEEHIKNLIDIILRDTYAVIAEYDCKFRLGDRSIDINNAWRLCYITVLDGIRNQVVNDDRKSIGIGEKICTSGN